MLEVLVHLEIDRVPPTFQLHKIVAPDSVAFEEWPTNDDYKNAIATRKWGDGWLAVRNTALARVPSVVAPHGLNWLLNPMHPDAGKIELEESKQCDWDARLLG